MPDRLSSETSRASPTSRRFRPPRNQPLPVPTARCSGRFAPTLPSPVILHGMARAVFLVPHVGQFCSNQIGVVSGSLIILAIALVTVRWIGASRSSQLLGIGVLWGGLTLAFEILFGRFVVGASWERLLSDYNVLQGGLMPFGMVVLVLSPWSAAKVRGVV